MTVDEAVAQAMAFVDERLESSLDDTEILLIDLGATDKELENALRDHHLTVLAWRRNTVAQIRAAFSRAAQRGIH